MPPVKPLVTLLEYTPEPEKLVAAAAKLCYASGEVATLMDNLTPEVVEKFLALLVARGHESPIEHVSFTFALEGVSRSLLAQITRHRLASYSVQSQRYVRKEGFGFILPPEIEAVPEAKALYLASMRRADEEYAALAKLLQQRHLQRMLAEGVPEQKAAVAAEKAAIEDARFVLPNACDTRIILTMNARSLYNFFSLRCCERAQWEIRAVAQEMLRLVKEVAPVLFGRAGPPCVRGACPEADFSCGKAAELRRLYRGEAAK